MSKDRTFEHLFVVMVASWFKPISFNNQRYNEDPLETMCAEYLFSPLRKRKSIPNSVFEKTGTLLIQSIFSFFGLSNIQPCCKLWIIDTLLIRKDLEIKMSVPRRGYEVDPFIEKNMAFMQLENLCQRNVKNSSEWHLYAAILTTWILGRNKTSKHLIFPVDFSQAMNILEYRYAKLYPTMYEWFTKCEENMKKNIEPSILNKRFNNSNWIHKTEINYLTRQYSVSTELRRTAIEKRRYLSKITERIWEQNSNYHASLNAKNIITGKDYQICDSKFQYLSDFTNDIRERSDAETFPKESCDSDFYSNNFDESLKKTNYGYDSGYEGDENELLLSRKYVKESTSNESANFVKNIKMKQNYTVNIPDVQKSDTQPRDIPPWMFYCGCDTGNCETHCDFESLQIMNQGIKASSCRQVSLGMKCDICEKSIFKNLALTTRFGLLLRCEHSFCLTCIQGPGIRDLNCPICNKSSPGVFPSSRWIGNGYEKIYLFQRYFSFLEQSPMAVFNSSEY